MRPRFLKPIAVALAIAASSFTAVPYVQVYMVYDNGNGQGSLSSYSQTLTCPGPCMGADVLCWFVINDNDGIISNTEFFAAFSSLDTNRDGSLDNELETAGMLEKRAD